MFAKVLFNGPCVEINGVQYRHHPNGGGLVAVTAKVAGTAQIDLSSMVKDHAEIGSYAKIEDGATICDHAVIEDAAEVYQATIGANVTVPQGTIVRCKKTITLSHELARITP